MGEQNYRCCCGVHVHTFTFVVALVVVLFWGLCAVGIILYGEWIALLICVPPLLSYGCLLIGNRTGRPGNYCPFLIVNLALVIGAFLFAGISYLTGAAFISHNFRIGSQGLETLLGSITVAIGTGAAIYAFLQFYYFYIVYRDYEYVKSKLSNVTEKQKPRESRQRRFYVDPKKLSEYCPIRKKKYSFKVDDVNKRQKGPEDTRILFPELDETMSMTRWSESYNNGFGGLIRNDILRITSV